MPAMDSQKSAFEIYNSQKIKPKEMKKSKIKLSQKSKSEAPKSKEINQAVMKEAGILINKNRKNVKEIKNIARNKIHKKKKEMKQRKKNSLKPQNKLCEYTKENSDISQLNPKPNKEITCKSVTTFGMVNDSVNGIETDSEFMVVQTDSSKEGLKMFKWMIAPYNVKEFFNQIWEKKPLHIARDNPMYYKELLTTYMIDNMLRTENIQFTKNIDITSYIDGKRETHNPEGRAFPNLVWDSYLNGCSIRLLNPQTYISSLNLLNTTLQEYFRSFVGANAYLTPPDSQGFAPHYDDIEAFILQTEGKKQWRIYKPREENEVLPRTSSTNFTDDVIGEPIMEVTLKAGDMIYFPRGYIHQGVTIDGEHSLHVTISMYQKHSWADLFEKMLPAALEMAISEDIELRRGLPLDIYDNFGLVYSDLNTSRKQAIADKILSLFDKIKTNLPINEAVDQMAKNYQRDALPPVLTDSEKTVTVYGNTHKIINDGKVKEGAKISLDTKIRLLRRNILRMVSEESIKLYYYTENSLEYHGSELPFLEIDEDMAPAIETLILRYPEYVPVTDLDVENNTDKLIIAETLWNRGLIMTDSPLK
ncbi:unnamed protein product [Leptosia nina]|uniref:Bifunctional lysine-specific demethylase and histidyl-hydroxylase n=1 Tax=Leptosia nina TaxID=320188 RepID=A0AAV1K0G3_9NEOP